MKINELKNNISDSLFSEIKEEECCLLDIPNHRNSGDHLIWQGEVDLLSNRIYYSCSLHFFNAKKVRDNTIILLHGGGNFGDTYRIHQEFRNKIIKQFPDHKIIILPQTIFYKTNEFLEIDKAVFSKHKNLTICARDNNSYHFALENFNNNKVVLLPDMAFCSSYEKSKKNKILNNILLIERTDKELNENTDDLKKEVLNIIKSDWPLFDFKNDSLPKIFMNKLKSLNNKISKSLIKTPFENLTNSNYGILTLERREKHVNNAIEFLSEYPLVITTRLHGFILCYLLGIPVIVLDNSYGKNKNFYNTWFKSQENTHFAKDKAEVLHLLKTKYKHLCQFPVSDEIKD